MVIITPKMRSLRLTKVIYTFFNFKYWIVANPIDSRIEFHIFVIAEAVNDYVKGSPEDVYAEKCHQTFDAATRWRGELYFIKVMCYR